jgi:hypothetical protein
MTISPRRASISFPSTVMLMRFGSAVSGKGAPAVFDVNEELVAEHLDTRHDR